MHSRLERSRGDPGGVVRCQPPASRCERVPDEPEAEKRHDTSPFTVRLGRVCPFAHNRFRFCAFGQGESRSDRLGRVLTCGAPWRQVCGRAGPPDASQTRVQFLDSSLRRQPLLLGTERQWCVLAAAAVRTSALPRRDSAGQQRQARASGWRRRRRTSPLQWRPLDQVSELFFRSCSRAFGTAGGSTARILNRNGAG